MKDLCIQKLNIMNVDRFDVLDEKTLEPAFESRPRPAPKKWVPKKSLKKRDPWLFEQSVFKDWKADTAVKVFYTRCN